MAEPHRNKLEKFDRVLDTILASEQARQKALHSGIPLLVVAAALIGASHPQLSPQEKLDLRDRIFRVRESYESRKIISFAELSQDNDALYDAELAHVANLLRDAKHPVLPFETRARILSKVLNSVQSWTPRLSDGAKASIFDKVLQAQQALQLDAMLESDEAFAIAQTSDDPLIQTGVQLASMPSPTLSDRARSNIHQQVFGSPATEKRMLRPNFAFQWKQVAASIMIILFVSLLSLPPAANSAMPGDFFYPVKRTSERVSLAIAQSDASRAQTHLNHAKARITEAERLLATGVTPAALLEDAFASLQASAQFVTDASGFVADGAFTIEISDAVQAFDALVVDVENANLITADIARQYQQQTIVLADSLPTTMVFDVPIPADNTQQNENNAPEIITTNEEPDAQSIETDTDDNSNEETEIILTDDLVILYANTSSLVNVRRDPNQFAEIVTQINPADAVTQIGENTDGTWLRVELLTGVQGWIAARLLTDDPAIAAVTSGIDVTDIPPETVSVTGTTITVNSQPNTQQQGQGQGQSNGESQGLASGQGNGQSNGQANGQGDGQANGQGNPGNNNGNPTNEENRGNGN